MARGKYAKVTQKLTRVFDVEPDYQEKVDACKRELAEGVGFEMSSAWLAQEYAATRDEKDAAEKVLSDVNLHLEALKQMIVERFDADGIDKLRTTDGQTVTVGVEPHAVIADPETFKEWCRRDPDLRNKMVLPFPTTNALVKERLLAGQPEPPGITTWARSKLTLLKERSAK